MSVETEIVVARPRQEVFDFVCWGENLPRWSKGFNSVQPLTGGPPTQGTQYQVSMASGGQSTFEYYDFVPGYRLSWHGSAIKMGPREVIPRGRFSSRTWTPAARACATSSTPSRWAGRAARPR